MQLKSWLIIAGIAACSTMAAGSFDRVGAVTTVLYDGTSGVTPDLYNAPNSYLSFTNLGTGTQTASGGATTLNTTLEATYAGYSNYNSGGSLVNSSFPVLDNSIGYTLSFTFKANSQTNNGTNGDFRAGFSAIVLGNDNRGIEIGFRKQNTKVAGLTPDIFSQNDSNFNSLGEQNNTIGTILDNLSTYQLNVLGNTYQLTSGGNTLLTGLVRDYTGATGPLSAVYRTPNFIFLGDNTTSAGASVDITNISITTNATSVPEPSNWIGIGLAIGFGIKLKARLSKSNQEFTKLLK
ncbi:choice-of-anchor Y domain-containing protein [Chamaesiphon polymorphus]|uniref:PEP-CTERM sorting domain-containing protein n=1 Tax=Chamaesiphon polymorphus CCALA 037 TaxID=2107692 RepID=A0A2T1GE03_9CYAN|nr:PEP-CTERM sorting domain-containing protein [Chamaesiphon polymorphus]PSB55686.1 PEP-CTERM sorting domain-containing protein [Chamaesiphon polymorphus CCALA 037]